MGKIGVREQVKRALEGGFEISVAMENQGVSGKVPSYDAACFSIEDQRIDYDHVVEIKAVPIMLMQKQAKTIKGKAREAWEGQLEVEVIVDRRNDPVKGTIPRYTCDAVTVETEFGDHPIFYYDITDILFVGEPETKEEEIRRICDEEYGDKSTLLREAMAGELGAENETLRRKVLQLECVAGMAEHREEALRKTIAELEVQVFDMRDRLVGFQSGNIPVGAEDPESLRQKLEHAVLSKCTVKVTWDWPSGQGEEEGIVYETMLNGFKFKHSDRKHDYAYMVSVEPIDEQPEGPESEPDGSQITDSTVGKLVGTDEPEDIAKQRWIVEEEDGGLTIRDADGNCLIMSSIRTCADSTAQIQFMAAAPELADMARELINKSQRYKIPDSLKDEWLDMMGLLVKLGVPGLQAMTFDASGNHISNARQIMREAFENDPEFKQTYVANIAQVIYDNGVITRDGCNMQAEKILDRMFEK